MIWMVIFGSQIEAKVAGRTGRKKTNGLKATAAVSVTCSPETFIRAVAWFPGKEGFTHPIG